MLLQVPLTLLQKNFEGGALAPLAPPLDPPLICVCVFIPKDSLTGRYAFTENIGVPATCNSSTTWPRFLLKTLYIPLTACSAH